MAGEKLQASIIRKSIPKKTRFDVFKRDGFCCQYCGSKPPAVVLEIDHIHPVASGGDNSIGNLITACFDCNRGKAANLLTSLPQSIEERADQLREKHEQLKAYERLIKQIKRKEDKDIDLVQEAFNDYFEGFSFSPQFRESVRVFIKKLGRFEVEDAMNKACSKIRMRDDSIKYFCGICWRMIREQVDA